MLLQRGRGKGEFWPGKTSEGMTAIIYCPKCGKGFHIMNHQIDSVGRVSPSVVEPVDCCGTFHEFVQLAGWADIIRNS